jgi:hypothetical protein
MASYASLAELKAVMGISDTSEDAALQLALDAATELIDEHCNRTFQVPSDVSTRYYTATSTTRVEIDDVYTTTGLVVSSYNVAVPAAVPYVSGGYELGPRNALAHGKPYTFLTYTSIWPLAYPGYFSVRDMAIAVTARFGFAAAVPVVIEQACILQANRIFARRGSPYGVAGGVDTGSEVRLLARVDPDVAVLLRPYVRMFAG